MVQTVAYAGYKFIYNSFGVRPEEVGYDYASLLPRTAYVVALLVSVGLAFLALASLTAAFYAGLLKPVVQDVWKGLGSSKTEGVDRGSVILFVTWW